MTFTYQDRVRQSNDNLALRRCPHDVASLVRIIVLCHKWTASRMQIDEANTNQ